MAVKYEVTPTRRRYHSPSRQRQARATREKIPASARRRFGADGYAATSIEAIAREAGVAVPTVYAIFRSKPAILLALLDNIERDAGLAGLHEQVAAADGAPARQIELVIAFVCRLFHQSLDVLDILSEARAADANLTRVWLEGRRRRRRGQSALVRSWANAKVLAPHLSPRRATDILWSLSGPEVYRLFVVESRWPVRRFERWLAETLVGLLLDTGSLSAR